MTILRIVSCEEETGVQQRCIETAKLMQATGFFPASKNTLAYRGRGRLLIPS